MTPRLASLPMYLANKEAVATLWDILRKQLAEVETLAGGAAQTPR